MSESFSNLPNPKRCNCLFWAVYVWATRGGYLLIRRSQLKWWIPHFGWANRELTEFWSYSPIKRKAKICYWPWNLILFKGRVKKEKKW